VPALARRSAHSASEGPSEGRRGSARAVRGQTLGTGYSARSGLLPPPPIYIYELGSQLAIIVRPTSVRCSCSVLRLLSTMESDVARSLLDSRPDWGRYTDRRSSLTSVCGVSVVSFDFHVLVLNVRSRWVQRGVHVGGCILALYSCIMYSAI
jgi:hypothetical protein